MKIIIIGALPELSAQKTGVDFDKLADEVNRKKHPSGGLISGENHEIPLKGERVLTKKQWEEERIKSGYKITSETKRKADESADAFRSLIEGIMGGMRRRTLTKLRRDRLNYIGLIAEKRKCAEHLEEMLKEERELEKTYKIKLEEIESIIQKIENETERD